MASFKRLALTALNFLGVNAASSHCNSGRIKTLIYHNVLPDTAAFPHSLTPTEFERQIAVIKEKYHPVHLDEKGAIVGLVTDRINVLITFDDGFINNYNYVFPILAKHGLKATFFLIVDCVETGSVPAISGRYSRAAGRTGDEYRTMSLPQIRDMMAAGMTFGSHTFAHTDFTQIEWAEGISIARESAEKLGALLHCEVKMFAFPWGRYRTGQPEALAGSFSRIFTTDHGFNHAGDIVMRRDEAVDEAHLQSVVSGSRDLVDGIRAIAGDWRRILLQRPHSKIRPASGDSDEQLNRPQLGDPDSDESKPLISFVLPSLGLAGAEIVAAALGREFLKRGFRTDFVLGCHEEEAFAVLPPSSGYIGLKAQPRSMLFPVARYLRERRPSAVIASQWPLTVMTIAAWKLAGSKARLAVCNHNTLSIQCGRLALPKRLLVKKSISLTYPFADARIAVSAGVADDLAALCDLRRDEISVVHNPLLERPTDSADLAAAEAIWAGWSGPRVLTVGNLRPEKNHALLIRAFKKLLAKQDARLLILGGDPGGNPRGIEEVKAYARSLDVADKVIVPGSVVNPTAYYLSANLFVLSSDTEGFGNVIIEALACGLPVVSTDCPHGPAEILAGGRYGRLTAVGDADALAHAILESLDSSHDPEALKRRASDYAVEKVAERYLRLLFPQECALLKAARSEDRSCAA